MGGAEITNTATNSRSTQGAVVPKTKTCKHHAKHCNVTSVKQCCACLDTSLRQGKCEANLYMGRKSHAATTTGKPWYADYCKGCYDHHHSVAERRMNARKTAFLSWKKDPYSDPALTGLAVNFYLRQAALPFEITHLVLSFALREPPLRFFRTFDRPTENKIVLKSKVSDEVEELLLASTNRPLPPAKLQANEQLAASTLAVK